MLTTPRYIRTFLSSFLSWVAKTKHTLRYIHFFLPFFLGWRRPKLITGPSSWWAPDKSRRSQETVPDRCGPRCEADLPVGKNRTWSILFVQHECRLIRAGSFTVNLALRTIRVLNFLEGLMVCLLLYSESHITLAATPYVSPLAGSLELGSTAIRPHLTKIVL